MKPTDENSAAAQAVATGDLFGHPRTNAKVASMIAAGQSPDGLEFFARELEIENRMLRDALTACHAAMLGKVNPKSPAWALLYRAQDWCAAPSFEEEIARQANEGTLDAAMRVPNT